MSFSNGGRRLSETTNRSFQAVRFRDTPRVESTSTQKHEREKTHEEISRSVLENRERERDRDRSRRTEWKSKRFQEQWFRLLFDSKSDLLVHDQIVGFRCQAFINLSFLIQIEDRFVDTAQVKAFVLKDRLLHFEGP